MTVRTAFGLKLNGLVAAVMILAAAGPASAQTADRLAEADANGDGNITWQEMTDARAATFARLDRNGDGFVDNNDSPRMGPMKARFQEAFAQLKTSDANGDGRISKSEMMNAPAPLFENGDTNGDKILSAAELSALREQASKQR